MDFQKQLFFNGMWSRFEDNSFLVNLEFFALVERKNITKDDREVLKKVRDWLNPKPVLKDGKWFTPTPLFTLTDIYRRFELAELRYHTWKHIIGYKGVEYNSSDNTAKISAVAMVEICEMHSLGKAYIWEPEHRWKELQNIFDPFGMRLIGPSRRTPTTDFSKMMEEMLADIEKENDLIVQDSDSSTDDEEDLPSIPPPDLMSSTKGKGHILFDPVAKPISDELRTMANTDPQAKASCSYVVKRFLKF